MLTPADIAAHQFNTTRLREGYDQDEVDTFLDRVHEDYVSLQQQLARAEEENRVLRRKLDAVSSETPTAIIPAVAQTPSAVAERLLAAAQQAHDEHVADGRAKADGIVRDAGAQGARIVEDAQAAAERIKSEALAEKYRRLEEVEAKQAKADKVLDDLLAKGREVRRTLADMVNSYDSEFPK